jgi:hypothetical protein
MHGRRDERVWDRHRSASRDYVGSPRTTRKLSTAEARNRLRKFRNIDEATLRSCRYPTF